MTNKYNEVSNKMLTIIAKQNGVDATLPREQIIAQLVALDNAVNGATQPEVKQSQAQSSGWSSVMNTTGGNQQRSRVDNGTPASEGMIKWAQDIARRFRFNFTEQDVNNIATMTRTQVQTIIDEYRYKDAPISPKQEQLIHDTCEEIRNIASVADVPTEYKGWANLNVPTEVIAGLTAGQHGTGSELIEKLFAMRKVLNPYRPLTDKQAQMILGWFFCPDVPFEDYEISKKVDGRLMTPDEFMVELKSKMVSADASFFIDQYMPVVREWEQTRCSQQQRGMIRTLESRMMDLSVGVKKEWAWNDETMQMEEVYQKRQVQYNPIAYEAMPEEFLLQMSKDDAEKYINQLRIELRRPIGGSIDNNPIQQQYEDKMQQRGKNAMDASIKEYNAINDITFKLDAISCFSNDELREDLEESMVHGVGSKSKALAKVQEYIELVVEELNGISVKNLIEMVSASQIVSQLVTTMYPAEVDEALNGKRGDGQRGQVEVEDTVQKQPDVVTDFMSTLGV